MTTDLRSFAMCNPMTHCLCSFSGKSHQVCSAVTMLVSSNFPGVPADVPSKDGYRMRSFTDTCSVDFGDISDDIIERYIATGEPMCVKLTFLHTE